MRAVSSALRFRRPLSLLFAILISPTAGGLGSYGLHECPHYLAGVTGSVRTHPINNHSVDPGLHHSHSDTPQPHDHAGDDDACRCIGPCQAPIPTAAPVGESAELNVAPPGRILALFGDETGFPGRPPHQLPYAVPPPPSC